MFFLKIVHGIGFLKESLSTTGLCARVLLFTPGLPQRGSHVWKLPKFFLSKDQLSTLSKMVDLSRDVEMEDSAEEEMVENYYGSLVAIATRRLQAASTFSATGQPISVSQVLNRVVSRELDKFIYDILNKNIRKYVSLFILQLPVRLAAIQQCVQRNLGNTPAVRVKMKVCNVT